MEISTAFQIALAAMFAELMEKMKASKWPIFGWITARTALLNKIVAALVGVLTAIGLTTAWVVDPVTHLGTISLGGIPTTIETFGTMVYVAFSQYWLMKGWYKGLIKNTETSADAQNVADLEPIKA